MNQDQFLFLLGVLSDTVQSQAAQLAKAGKMVQELQNRIKELEGEKAEEGVLLDDSSI